MNVTTPGASTTAPRRADLEDAILGLKPGDESAFLDLAKEIRAYQRRYNPVVGAFADAGRFMPASAFRETRVASFLPDVEEGQFLSSGTRSQRRSIHPVRSFAFYDRVVEAGFDRVFGGVPMVLVGHLPQYADESSLVRMTRHLAYRTGHDHSAVFADSKTRLKSAVQAAERDDRLFVLLGAAFGLLDLVQTEPVRLTPGSIVIETGGMKTHRREMTREELHDRLALGFGLATDHIWSEYGMCELSSQAWARGDGWYESPPWMRAEVVDPSDPDRRLADGQPGLLAITDLANLYTASFLLTEDLAVADGDRFSVIGRATGAMLRGCNFLLEP